MHLINDESGLASSLVVFRALYNAKSDLYGVISELLNFVIKETKKYRFNTTEITHDLNDIFHFDIPEAVVHTSLKRLNFLKKEYGYFTVINEDQREVLNIENTKRDAYENNQQILDNLYRFVEQKKSETLTDDEKEKIRVSLFQFLLDKNEDYDYYDYISAFIISNSQNISFKDSLNKIREGMILYSGIKYNPNLSEIGSWKNKLTIFLDTEILFHAYGYNGELYKTLFDDFYKYVKEINSKSTKPLIKLRYFKEVKEEVDAFFTVAERIIRGKATCNPSATAMASIVNGCSAASDISEKKSDFFTYLRQKGILEFEDINFYDQSNHKYNLVDESLIKKITHELGFDAANNLKQLNYINILRKEDSENNFYNIRFILLTGNKNTIKVAWHELVKDEGQVPLATTLYWLTSKFWFKLNKGFGDDSVPKSVDVISKAQIVLSSLLSTSVEKKYDEVRDAIVKGDISEDQVKARILDLRRDARKPEEIEPDEVSEILEMINDDSLERFIKEQEHFKMEAKKHSMPIRMLHTSRFSVMSQRGGVQHGKKFTEVSTRFPANFPRRGSMLYLSLCGSFSKWFHLSIL